MRNFIDKYGTNITGFMLSISEYGNMIKNIEKLEKEKKKVIQTWEDECEEAYNDIKLVEDDEDDEEE